MQIFRFDEEVSIPISEHGSRFRIGPLAETAGAVVKVLHLPPDGLVGRHPAAAQQLLAVVSGSGWVSGSDGDRCEIRSGYAALWEAGEEHETSSGPGLTAVCIEGSFDVLARP